MFKRFALFLAALVLAACAPRQPAASPDVTVEIAPVVCENDGPTSEAPPVREAGAAPVLLTDGSSLLYDTPVGWKVLDKDVDPDAVVLLVNPAAMAHIIVIEADADSPVAAVVDGLKIAMINGCWGVTGVGSSRDGSAAWALADGCMDGSHSAVYAERLGGVVYQVMGHWMRPTEVNADLKNFRGFTDSLRLE